MKNHDKHPSGQFALMAQRRFAPFFWVQFLGAGNDNLFKVGLTILVTYQLQLLWLPPAQAGLVIGALFILPFLLFSATSGQIADKYDKTRLMQGVKVAEIAIMLVAAAGFFFVNVPLLLACVFLMGTHAAVNGPSKYAYMPQHLGERELTGGNGLVEMGTFTAILLGNVAGSLLIATPQGNKAVAACCLMVATSGFIASLFMPRTPATDPALRVNWNPLTETWRNLRLARESLAVFRSLLGISWLWAFGAVFLANFPAFAKDTLHGDEGVAALLLVVFSVGIGVGSLLCEVLSRRHVEIGLVPLGALGMSVFGIDLYFAVQAMEHTGVLDGLPAAQVSVADFLAQPGSIRLLADLALMALCAGLYSVPMYALIQMRAKPTHRSRIIAANNILNSLFMIASSLAAGMLLSRGWSVPEVFFATALLNLAVGAYIFLLVPEYLLRFFAFVLTRCAYRLKVHGDSHIPADGPAIIACNHVSFIDAILLMAVSPRPIRFLMDHRIFSMPVIGAVFRLAKAIPIAPRDVNPQVYEEAFETADRVLAEGDLLGIFPEGSITRDGALQDFRPGIMKVLARRPAPVVPIALQGMWGSFFSRVDNGRAMTKPFRRGAFNRIGLVVGHPLAATDVTPQELRQRVSSMLEQP